MVKDKNGKLLQVRSDILFHDLFNENDITTLEWVVSKILDVDYEEVKGKVSVLNTRLARVNRKERNKYVDLQVEYKDEKIIIELNNNFEGIYTRNLLYATNVLLNNYKITNINDFNSYYKKVVRVLLVNLNWYKGKKGENIPPKKIYEIPYSDIDESGYLLKIVNVNLDSYKDICYDKINQVDKFYKLLTIDNNNDLDEVIQKESLLENYSNKLKDLSSNSEYKEDMMDEIIEENVARQTAYLLGEQSGIEKATIDTKKELVTNMYKDNLEIELISKYANLSVSEVEKIIRDSCL